MCSTPCRGEYGKQVVRQRARRVHLQVTVYGRDDEDLAWLSIFHRRLMPTESGHIVLVDDFSVCDDRESASVSEYWCTMPWTEAVDIDNCEPQDKDVQVSLSDDQVDLIPACTSLGNLSPESPG